MKILSAALVAAICLSTSAASAADWATLKVKVVFDGKQPKLPPLEGTAKEPFCVDKKLPNELIVVGAKGELSNLALIMDMRKSEVDDIHPDLAKPPTEPLVIDNKDCIFEPRVSFLQAGRPVIVKNSDKCAHNYKIDPFSNDPINILVPIGGQIQAEFKDGERSNFSEYGCTIHPWMKGQLIIREHPYVGVSDKKGELVIKDLPAGKLTFKVVHEAMNRSIKEITLGGKKMKTSRGNIEVELKPGMNDLGTLVVAPDQFDL
ncbi:MAG TPA: hypothetical protein DDW52_15680 [Planctomycetaceae bacterium]|nr:hypothetical protein [Planctomycetaceae bacterium]